MDNTYRDELMAEIRAMETVITSVEQANRQLRQQITWLENEKDRWQAEIARLRDEITELSSLNDLLKGLLAKDTDF